MLKVDVEDQWRRSRIGEGRCCCGKKVADLIIYLFSATNQDRVGPSLRSRNMLFTSADCCTHCTAKLDL